MHEVPRGGACERAHDGLHRGTRGCHGFCRRQVGRVRLGQLIDDDAVHHTDGACRIDFGAVCEDEGKADERVVLKVRDNGCGVSAADRGRVWRRVLPAVTVARTPSRRA